MRGGRWDANRSSVLPDRTSRAFKNGQWASLPSCAQERVCHEKTRRSGFTLIEAMVVVAVLGILAAISVPNYSRYVTRGHLVDAGNALSEYRIRMEQFYQDNRTYARAGVCGQAVPTNLDNFAIACAIAAGGQAFTATATGAGSTAGFVYTINQANVRSTTAIPSHWGTLARDAGIKWVTQ